MGRRRISRRDALGVIGSTGATLGAGTFFFLSLRTSPLDAAPEHSVGPGLRQKIRPPSKTALQVAEKVVVSGAGSTILFRISGPPGRYCGVSYATADAREHYRAATSGRGIIGKDGSLTIEVDTKNLPSQKLYFRVVTGKSGAFNEDVRGTQSFEVFLSKGTIARFGGVRERPLENVEACASVASAGYQSKPR